MSVESNDLIKVLDLVVIPSEYKVLQAGEDLSLPKLSFELLVFFLHQGEKISTLEQISEGVWGNRVVSSDTVVQRITLLRKALSDDAKSPKYIESVRGRGYRLLTTPSMIKKDQLIKPSNTFLHKRMIYIVSIIGMVFIVLWLAWSQLGVSTNIASGNINNSEASLLIERGKYYYKIGQNKNLELANRLFEQALELEPNNIEALLGLSLSLSKSVCRYNQKVTFANQGKNLAQKAIQLDNTNSAAYNALAYAWDCIGNLELALANYAKASELNPQSFASIGSAAHLYAIKGELITAYELSKEVSSNNPSNYMAQLQLASILGLMNFHSEASNRLENLFSLYPDNVFINEAYPTSLYHQGMLEQSKQAFTTALNRDVNRIGLYSKYAEVLWLLDGKTASIQYFQKAAELSSNNSFASTVNKILNAQMSELDANYRLQTIEAMVEQGNTWPINYIEAAIVSLWVIDSPQQSIDYLNKAYEKGFLHSEYLAISPFFQRLSTEESGYKKQFDNLIARINNKRESLKQAFLAKYASELN